MGLAQRLLRRHGLSLLSEGILYDGIVHTVSATYQSKQIYLNLDVDFQKDATPWSARVFAQVSQGTPLPEKGARVVVMVKPNKPTSAAVYVGKAGLMLGKAAERKG